MAMYVLHVIKGKEIEGCLAQTIMPLLLSENDDPNATAHILFFADNDDKAKVAISNFMQANIDLSIDECMVTKAEIKRSDIPGLKMMHGNGFICFYLPIGYIEQEICHFW